MKRIAPRPLRRHIRRASTKYGNTVCVGKLGEIYASKAERAFADILEYRRQIGTIDRWSWSPRFLLQSDPLITIRWDFVYWPMDDETPNVVDVKSPASAKARDFSVKVRMWKSLHPDIPIAAVINGEEEWL